MLRADALTPNLANQVPRERTAKRTVNRQWVCQSPVTVGLTVL